MATFPPLSFESFGPADAPTLVFLHGGGSGAWMWHPVISHLPEFHCLAPDQPEHGAKRLLHVVGTLERSVEGDAPLLRRLAVGGGALLVVVAAVFAFSSLQTDAGGIDHVESTENAKRFHPH